MPIEEEEGKNFRHLLGCNYTVVQNSGIIGRQSSVLPYCKFFSCYS